MKRYISNRHISLFLAFILISTTPAFAGTTLTDPQMQTVNISFKEKTQKNTENSTADEISIMKKIIQTDRKSPNTPNQMKSTKETKYLQSTENTLILENKTEKEPDNKNIDLNKEKNRINSSISDYSKKINSLQQKQKELEYEYENIQQEEQKLQTQIDNFVQDFNNSEEYQTLETQLKINKLNGFKIKKNIKTIQLIIQNLQNRTDNCQNLLNKLNQLENDKNNPNLLKDYKEQLKTLKMTYNETNQENNKNNINQEQIEEITDEQTIYKDQIEENDVTHNKYNNQIETINNLASLNNISIKNYNSIISVLKELTLSQLQNIWAQEVTRWIKQSTIWTEELSKLKSGLGTTGNIIDHSGEQIAMGKNIIDTAVIQIEEDPLFWEKQYMDVFKLPYGEEYPNFIPSIESFISPKYSEFERLGESLLEQADDFTGLTEAGFLGEESLLEAETLTKQIKYAKEMVNLNDMYSNFVDVVSGVLVLVEIGIVTYGIIDGMIRFYRDRPVETMPSLSYDGYQAN